jgi:hypothetical protein
VTPEDSTGERLDDQLGWYGRNSRDNQRRYQWLKLLKLVVAGRCPGGWRGPPLRVTGLVAVIVVRQLHPRTPPLLLHASSPARFGTRVGP